MAVDPRARSGFGGDVRLYERGRPSYPDEAIAHAARALGLPPQAAVIDLAAGTGKLTRVLARAFESVTAVEPSPAMRAALHQALPDVRVLPGTAEALPLPAESVDAVFVGEAFHWFRPGEAAREIARVLRPGGGLVALWNRGKWEKEDHPWLPAFRALADTYREEDFPGGDRWRPALEAALGPISEHELDHIHHLDADGFTALVASWSWIANLPPDERARTLAAVREVVASHAPLALRFRTEIYWTRR